MSEKRFRFTFTVEEEDDGRWSARLNAIPWCATFGNTKEEAIEELRDAARVVVREFIATGKDIPADEPLEVVV